MPENDSLEYKKNTASKNKKEPLYLIIVFLILTLGIGVIGYFYYDKQKNNLTQKVQNELSAIGVLKVNQIISWRGERISDGEVISHNQFLVNIIEEYLNGKNTNKLKKSLLSLFNLLIEQYEYKCISVFDKNGNLSMTTSSEREEISEFDSIEIQKSKISKRVILSDIHTKDSSSKNIHLDLFVPLIESRGFDSTYVGLMILEIDPSSFLFPLIQSWPVPSSTSESMLIKREGDFVLHLTELRNKKNTALKLRVPIDLDKRISVLAINGVKGITEGDDYNGDEVIAYIQEIPGTKWYLINKVDKTELYSSIREQTDLILALACVLIIACASSIGFYWHRRNLKYYQIQYKIDLEKKAISERYRYLLKYANDAIFLLDKNFNIIEANKKAVDEYGYDMSELNKLNVIDLQSGNGIMDFEKNIDKITSSDGIIFESEHIRKDGTVISVEVSARSMRINQEIYYQDIVRDITDRKRAEQKLIENEIKYRELVEQAADGIVINDEKGEILFVNPKTCNMLGYNETELLNSNISNTCDEAQSEMAYVQRHGLVNGLDMKFEQMMKRKNGTIFPVEISLKRLQSKHYQGIIRDITERKTVEDKLRKSEEQFSRLFENIPIGVYRTTPDGRILMANKALIEMLGYDTFEEFSGRNLEKGSTHQGYSRSSFKELLEKKGEIKGYEFEWTRKDGSPIHVRENARIVRDSNGDVFCYEGTVEDINEKKRMEKILKEKEETSRALINAISESVIFFDTNGVILAINETACKRLEQNEGQLIGKNLKDVYSGKLLEDRRKKAEEVVMTGKPQRMEDERNGRNYDIALYPVLDENGEVKKIAVFGKDVTDQKHAEEMLKILYLAVEQSPASVVITDTNGDIEYVNPKFAEVTGFNSSEVVGKNPRILKSGNTSDEEYKNLWNTITKGDVWHGEFLNKRKTGEEFWESALISPIKNSIGQIAHYLGVKEDISEKKTREDQIKNSLKEKEILLREIYHRVKNNLQIIISLLKLQQENLKDPQAAEYLKISRTRVRTMALIHEQLYRSKDLSRIYFEDYVSKLVYHLLQVYDNNRVSTNIRIKNVYLEIETAIPCGLIINEIISNSLKHAFSRDIQGRIEIEMTAITPGKYKLRIKDNGVGFPEDLDFKQTSSLGMQLVVTLTEQLDGTITMNRENGTEFTIIFSVAEYGNRLV